MMKCERCGAEGQVIVQGIGLLCRADCQGRPEPHFWSADRVVVATVVLCLIAAVWAVVAH